MNIRSALLATAAASTLLASGALAAPAKKKHASGTTASATSALLQEVRELKAQVEELRAKVDSQETATAETAARANNAQVAAAAAQTQVQAVQTQVTTAPAVTPAQVDTRIASAIDKEHHNDKFYFKGITITPGGYLELAGIYRDHFQGNDISSSFNVNFPNVRQYYQHEGRFTARQSRLSFLAEGAINKNIKAAMYGEFDFQGGAQTANSNQSNSYNPRIRNLYGTIDWNQGDWGLHFLAGQNWSLVTLQSKGISPRAEVTPPQIDAQYIPGFAWARQPGIRVAADFMNHKLWVAASVENAANNTITAVASATSQASGVAAGTGFDSANNLSFNDVPDVIAKVAYEDQISGHNVHVEGFGIVRTFNERLITGGATNHSISTLGYGGSINVQVVPKVLDAQFSGFGGQGIGRYGSAGLADVTYSSDGRIHPIDEYMLLGGLTFHATKALDLYGFWGEEQESRTQYAPNFGAPTTLSAGCFVETGACGQNTRAIRQWTGGFWDKFYQGSFGRAQVGIQFSHTERQLFYSNDIAGFAKAKNDMAFLSFRYYPF